MSKIITRFLTIALLLVASVAARAQDRIYLNDGTTVEGKVTEINSKSIIYRREDSPNGPDYVLNRREVSRIKYENGVEEKMIGSSSGEKAPQTQSSRTTAAHSAENQHPTIPYGKNIIAFAPILLTVESATGVGISFEHFVDKNNMFSVYLPAAFSFFKDDPGTYPTATPAKNRVYTTLFPGLKIYPGGSNKRVSYSVGPSFGLGFGTQYHVYDEYDPITGFYRTYAREEDEFKAGFMVNNGLNIQPGKSLYVGLEFGIGILYYSNHNDAFEEPLLQFQFKMGYRF